MPPEQLGPGRRPEDGVSRGQRADGLPAVSSRPDSSEDRSPSLGDAFKVWTRIGLLSFGGPAGQIALIHKEVVEDRGWLDDRTFLSALNFCMLLPGPEAMQLATFAGWRLHGVIGGLIAGLMFVLPGAVLVGVLSALYAVYGALPISQVLFLGVKAAVLAIVVQALLKVGQRALTAPAAYILAIAAFVGLFLFQLPFPLIVVAAALVGMFVLPADRGTVDSTSPGKAGLSDARPSGSGPLSLALRAAAVWGAIWVLPLVGVVSVFGTDSVFADLALFFSKLAVVTFGGAYAVLSYVAQEAVSGYGWLKPGEMVDGLGLAETTPGPLILVTQFVAFLGAFRADADMPLLFGLFGMVVTLWATFAPCFLWIFVGAPFIAQLESLPRLRSALAGVTAAVVGVIANLSVWFAMNVLFYELQAVDVLGGQLSVPVVASLNVNAAILAVVGFVALFAVRLGVLFTLAVCALGGLLLSVFV